MTISTLKRTAVKSARNFFSNFANGLKSQDLVHLKFHLGHHFSL